MSSEHLRDVLDAHARWIASNTLRGARAQLSGQRFHAANLEGADLRWAHLRDTDWTGARMARVNIACADLRGAVLRGADLRGACLVLAQLQGADLRDADLREAVWVRHRVHNELDLPQVFLAANLTGARLEGARVNRSALKDTGARGPHKQSGDLEDLAEPQPPRGVVVPTPAGAPSLRGHERSTLIELAKHVVAALPELSPLASGLENPTWCTGAGDDFDTYEMCAVGVRPALTVQLTIHYSDSSAGPVVNRRDASFHVVMPNGDALLLGWTGSGELQHRHGDPQLFARVRDHLSAASVR